MPHYNAYESFQTKKSKEKKQRAIEKSTKKKNNKLENFVIENNDKYGIVVEVRYNDAYICAQAQACQQDPRLLSGKQVHNPSFHLSRPSA